MNSTIFISQSFPVTDVRLTALKDSRLTSELRKGIFLVFPGVAADYFVEKKTARDVKMFHRTESRKYRILKVFVHCPLKKKLWSKVKCHCNEKSNIKLSVHH